MTGLKSLSHRMTLPSSARLAFLALVALWAFNMVMAQSTTLQTDGTESYATANGSTTATPSQSTTGADSNSTGSAAAPSTTMAPPEASTAPSGSMSVWAGGNSMLISGLIMLCNYLLFTKAAH